MWRVAFMVESKCDRKELAALYWGPWARNLRAGFIGGVLLLSGDFTAVQDQMLNILCLRCVFFLQDHIWPHETTHHNHSTTSYRSSVFDTHTHIITHTYIHIYTVHTYLYTWVGHVMQKVKSWFGGSRKMWQGSNCDGKTTGLEHLKKAIATKYQLLQRAHQHQNWKTEKLEKVTLYDIFFNTMCIAVYVLLIWGRDATRYTMGRRKAGWGSVMLLGNVLLRHFGSWHLCGCYFHIYHLPKHCCRPRPSLP